MKIDPHIVLSDSIVSLYPLHTKNISPEYVASIANVYDIAKYVGHNFPHPYGIAEAISFNAYAKSAWENGSEYVFAIFIGEVYAGNIGIKYEERDKKIGNLGYWIGKEFEGMGYMTRSVALIVSFCFDVLNVRKMEAGVYSGNEGSMAVLLKNGFKKEGAQEKTYMLKDGTILDAYLYGLFK